METQLWRVGHLADAKRPVFCRQISWKPLNGLASARGGRLRWDGASDILWRNAAGTLDIWFTRDEGSSNVSGSPGTLDLGWQVAGIADSNGDLRSDILWRNSSGALAVWLMNGAAHADEYPGIPPLDWKIEKLGDFNGDQNADILWRHTNGTLATWFRYGGLIFAQGYPGVVSSAVWTVTSVAQID